MFEQKETGAGYGLQYQQRDAAAEAALVGKHDSGLISEAKTCSGSGSVGDSCSSSGNHRNNSNNQAEKIHSTVNIPVRIMAKTIEKCVLKSRPDQLALGNCINLELLQLNPDHDHANHVKIVGDLQDHEDGSDHQQLPDQGSNLESKKKKKSYGYRPYVLNITDHASKLSLAQLSNAVVFFRTLVGRAIAGASRAEDRSEDQVSGMIGDGDGGADIDNRKPLPSDDAAAAAEVRRIQKLYADDADPERMVRLPGIEGTVGRELVRYWLARYTLFSRFDRGIVLDGQGLFSVTPEAIARRQAERCSKANVKVNIDVDVSVNIDSNVNIDSDVDIDANVNIDADVDIDANVNIDADVDIDANVNIDADVDIDGDGASRRTPPAAVVIDAFTGAGGNAIQFACMNLHVVAIDIDPAKIEHARNNARVYGVHDRIDFIVGDFFRLAPSLKADVVFLSPPWGGPEYIKAERYDIKTMLQPADGYTLFKLALSIAPNVAYFLPKTVDPEQMAELALLSDPPLPFLMEKNHVQDELKAVTVYYGNIAL